VGRVGRGSPAAGRPRPQNDTWIAACCLRYQVPLVTLNTADFTDFATRHGLVLLGEQM
jgi:toxin FitB